MTQPWTPEPFSRRTRWFMILGGLGLMVPVLVLADMQRDPWVNAALVLACFAAFFGCVLFVLGCCGETQPPIGPGNLLD